MPPTRLIYSTLYPPTLHRRIRALILVSIMGLPLVAQAKEKLMPMSEMRWLGQLPTSTIFDITPTLNFTNEQEQKCKGADVAFLLGDKIHPILILEDGSAALTVPKEFFDQSAKMRLRKADDEGPCSLAMYIAFTLKSTATTPRYQDYMDLERIYDTVVKSQAGLFSFMAPDFEGVFFVFEPLTAATLTLEFADGQSHRIDAVDNKINLGKNSAWAKANPGVKLSHAPIRITPIID